MAREKEIIGSNDRPGFLKCAAHTRSMRCGIGAKVQHLKGAQKQGNFASLGFRIAATSNPALKFVNGDAGNAKVPGTQ